MNTACVKEINKFLCLENVIKVQSKKYRKHTWVVLFLSFFSIDQIEKRLHTLFAAGDSDWEPVRR